MFATAKILIWKQFTTINQVGSMLSSCVCNCKDTNLKAIHNSVKHETIVTTVVFATAKILIWKQFTTIEPLYIEVPWLCLQLQRYYFESNSQLERWYVLIPTSCVCNCKDTNLKAIHNHFASLDRFQSVVFATAKILIWKQFTTPHRNP